MDKQTLLLVDGLSVAFRAFYAVPLDSLRTSTGGYTNAVYGFISMLVKMIEDHNPDHIAVAFDMSRHSFRTDEYPEYKGTRDETPKEFIPQVDSIKTFLEAAGITYLEKENFEADDILATLAKQGEESGMRVLVASGDRDTFQLITEAVSVLYPGRTTSDIKLMTPAQVMEKYQVPPSRYPEIAALVGEKSDNLPGVPGVGDKTAADWINKYDGLDNILADPSQIGGKRGQALREHVEDVKRNRRLNRLRTDVDLPVEVSELGKFSLDRPRLDKFFDLLEINRLRKRVYDLAPETEAQQSAPAVAPAEVVNYQADFDLDKWLKQHATGAAVYVSATGQGWNQAAHAIAICDGQQNLRIDFSVLLPQAQEALDRWLAADNGKIVVDAKAMSHALRGVGFQLGKIQRDLALEAYVLRPDMRAYTVEELGVRYLGRELDEGEKDLLSLINPVAETQRSQVIWEVADKLAIEMENASGHDLVTQMELPLQEVLILMEQRGIAADLEVLNDLRQDFSHQVNLAQEQAYAAIGGKQVNLASPMQLQEVLFEDLDMPKTRRTKRGYTTNAAALADLFAKTRHPFLAALLAHRDKTKLLQTVEGLIKTVDSDGRIHTTFQQTVTATGRLSSTDPNLQNIPARTEDGLQIRRCFVAGDGFESLMTADYSQIEMRIMADMSADKALIDAFKSGEDLHRTMAALVFGKNPKDVTSADRSHIKATSYGLAYGLSAYGLSKQLDIEVGAASALMDKYFERFGGVRDYLNSVVEQARRDGYTQTKFGRRRYLPGLNSQNRQVREMAERAALNAPIQGTAADIIKIAMIEVEKQLSGYKSRILLQVHDELVLEIAPGEREEVEAIVRECMGHATQLSVPLEVSVGVGHSWKDAAH